MQNLEQAAVLSPEVLKAVQNLLEALNLEASAINFQEVLKALVLQNLLQEGLSPEALAHQRPFPEVQAQKNQTLTTPHQAKVTAGEEANGVFSQYLFPGYQETITVPLSAATIQVPVIY